MSVYLDSVDMTVKLISKFAISPEKMGLKMMSALFKTISTHNSSSAKHASFNTVLH